jgi:hypothetical protein
MSVLVKLQQLVEDAQKVIERGDIRTYEWMYQPKINETAAQYKDFKENDRKRLAEEIDWQLRSHSPGVDVSTIVRNIRNN